MGLDVSFQDREDGQVTGPFRLASAAGWGLATDWIADLPAEYAQLHRLAVTGQCGDTSALVKEIESSMTGRYVSPDVVHTLHELAELIGMGSPTETCRVYGED